MTEQKRTNLTAKRSPLDPMRDPVELIAVMSRAFADSRNIESTLRRGLVAITDYLEAEGGAVFLLSEDGVTLRCTAAVRASTGIEGMEMASDRGIVGRCAQHKRGELVRDAKDDPEFFADFDEVTRYQTQSIVCAPMSVRDECIGAVELVNKVSTDAQFTDDDLHILQAMASAAALAILNARMSESLVEQERLGRELELAAEIQRNLLPPEQDTTFPIHGISLPAYDVTGDFYDFFTLADGQICFIIGDVAGKGMNAALLMAKTASLARGFGKTIRSPASLLSRINREIYDTNTRGMFVTMVAGVYDPKSGAVRLFNAGHQPPLLRRADGRFETITEASIPLGIDPDPAYRVADEMTIALDGGCLYIVTDGVTEGILDDGSELKETGLMATLNTLTDRPVAEQLVAVASLFSDGERTLRDDVTMIAIDDRVTLASSTYTRDRGLRSDDRDGDDADVAEEIMRLTIPAHVDQLRLVRKVIEPIVGAVGCSDPTVKDIVLGIDEACHNVIEHAYGLDPSGTITVIIRRQEGRLVVLLCDLADPVDVEDIKPRDEDDLRPGGQGTRIIQSVFDEVEFLPTPPEGGNVLRMVKRIKA